MRGQIPRHFIDELLARVDIVAVIDQRVPLKSAGRDHKACCPFHSEKTPSFTVSSAKQFYHCFGCGANGNAIGFLMEHDQLHFVEAVETLAESIGMTVPREGGGEAPADDHRPLYARLDTVAAWYVQQLESHEPALDYLRGRGLDAETCARYSIGYAPDGWEALTVAFPGHEGELVRTGMLKYRDDDKPEGRPYQRFRDRMMFPIRDGRGRVIAFGGRLLGDGEPKYLNSPESPVFHKGREVYGLHEARRSARERGSLLIVEGYMDVVALARHGVTNAVATLGTAINERQVDALYRVVPSLVFCFDGDRAGRAAAWRAVNATLPALTDGRDAHFLFLPEGEDPDTIVQQEGAAGFDDRLAARVGIIDFLYAQLADGLDTDGIGGKARLADEARPLLERIPHGVYRQLAVRRLETLIGVPIPGLSSGGTYARRSFDRERSQVRERASRATSSTDANRLTTMSRVVMLVLQHPVLVSRLPVDAFDFDERQPGADVLTRLVGFCDAEPSLSTARLVERFADEPVRAHLQRLAVRPWFPDSGHTLDEAEALAELEHQLGRLRLEGRPRTRDRLAPDARRGLLSRRRRPADGQ